MSFLLARIVRFAAQRIAFDPKARSAVVKAARGAADGAKSIITDENPARAAGQSLRRLRKKLKPGSADD